ncbi:leucine-rich repeat-containing DDB_G0290503 isoform X1 [Paramuricea clavata]|nr:leucine-rich repeat-containing DDB_G0290503 isoform X1 [Paramuricea clavata]
MDDKSNLQQLSKCLNDASNLINTMLDTDTQRHQPGIASAQPVPRAERPREAAVNVPSVRATINSAVDRARLMIGQSSSRGLCSRLNRRERLRATSSKPSTSTTTKKPRLEKKVFEFVLLSTEDCDGNDDKDTMLFSESMVAIRGFIEIPTTASEVDIRTELGKAIQLKFPMVSKNDFEFVRANRRRITKPVSCNEYNYNQVKLLAGQGCIYLKMKDGLECLFVEDAPGDGAFDFEKEENSQPKEESTQAITEGPSATASSIRVSSINTHQVLQQQSSILPTNTASLPSGSSPRNPVMIPPQYVDASSSIPPLNRKTTIFDVAADCVTYCKEHNIDDPVEILRYAQNCIVTGKPLNGYTGDEETLDGESNFILINRHDVLATALEEIGSIENPQLTLEVSFYGENAQDAGGPRREFFRLCLQQIMEKYFNNGLREHISEDYKTVGLIMALSILQNGNIPRFPEELLQEIFIRDVPQSKCVANLREGFNKLGLREIVKNLPILLHLFRPSSTTALTRRKLMHMLTPMFSEDGCNARSFENVAYAAFSTYTRKAAGGKRGNVTLEHILQFVSGTDQEPLLGFCTKPSIVFPSSTSSGAWSFIPTSNTCANVLHLPCPSNQIPLPTEEKLFEVYDMAFCNAYFGKH